MTKQQTNEKKKLTGNMGIWRVYNKHLLTRTFGHVTSAFVCVCVCVCVCVWCVCVCVCGVCGAWIEVMTRH